MRPLAYLWLFLAVAPPNAAWAGRSATLASLRPPTAAFITAGPGARTTATFGAADPSAWCETAVTSAEYSNRLPPRLLAAISLTETGRVEAASGRFRPWPWTINAAGMGHFFRTSQQAINAVKALQARGVRSIDVGCLQVNLMYHPRAFASLQEAFDPRINAAYAARFLNALYADSKSWSSAIAAYHSETPVLGDAYRSMVMAHWQPNGLHVGLSRARAYGDFAAAGRVYGDRAPNVAVYGAFAPRAQTYGAFAPR